MLEPNETTEFQVKKKNLFLSLIENEHDYDSLYNLCHFISVSS